VLLASSDFTHYGRAFGYLPFPNDRWTSEHLRDLDDDLIEAAGSLDVAFFEKELRRTQATLCGRGPISLLLAVLHKLPGEEIFQEKLDYQTSGEITGDWGHSVSYAALGYFRQQSFCLDEEDRRLLIDSARRTLATYDWGRSATPVPPAVNTPALSRKCGAFVSLHHKGRLMGCIGCREGADPLHTSVPELAISALHDPRFQPPTPQEVAEADLEISVLTPMKRLPDPAHLQAGIHGAYLEAGGHQGLLLPQVATEYGMNRDEFLRALTKKAGASQDACHRPDSKLYVFQAQRFGG
jgi:AmmeMemoRadiSam system protein A